MTDEKSSRSFDWWKILTLLSVTIGIVVQRHALSAFFEELVDFLDLHRQSNQDKSLFVLHLVHLLFLFNIIILVRLRFWNKDAMVGVNDKVQRTFQAFRSSWILMWTAWIIAYTWLAVRSGVLPSPAVLNLVTTLANIYTGFAVWCCFFVLDRGIDKCGEAKIRALRAGSFCLLIGILDYFRNWGHLGLAISGLYTGLGLTCLVGRLGSHYIKLPSSLVMILYVYGMLQLYYPFFDTLPRPIPWLLFVAALILKVLLSIAGFQMLESGGLKNYLTVLVDESEINQQVAIAVN